MKKSFSQLSLRSWQSIWSVVSPIESIEPTGLSSVSLLHSLVHLRLGWCNLTEITNDLSILSSLKELDLSGNPFISLPENLKSLIALGILKLCDCPYLVMLPELPPTLYVLGATRCTSMKKVTNLPNRSTASCVDLQFCEKLVEVQGVYCIKPLIDELDAEMIRKIGLHNLESFERTEVYKLWSGLTLCRRECPLQGLYEFGIFSIFLHGSKIPDWYNYRGESALSIVVPSRPKLKFIGLNIGVVYVGDAASITLKVSNEARGLMWAYFPVTMGVPKQNEEMSWLSHWPFENNEIEGGEELRFSVDSVRLAFPMRPQCVGGLIIKELGVQLVYEHENEGKIQLLNPEDDTTQHEAPYWRQNIPPTGNVSAPNYQIRPGKYFLTNNYLLWHSVLFLASFLGDHICEHQGFDFEIYA